MEKEIVMALAEELLIACEVRQQMAVVMDKLPWDIMSPLSEQLTDSNQAEEAWQKLVQYSAPFEGDSGMGQLTVFLAAACHTRNKYKELGISDSIFLDTMGCFKRFLEETKEITGNWIFDRGFWVWRQTSCLLFRLGTLEFEYWKAEGILPDEIKENDMAISVHIPSDAVLTEEKLAESYEAMRTFWTAHENQLCPMGKPKIVFCSTWLLSPELQKLLPENSGIRRFASEYRIYHQNLENKGFYRWLFNGRKELDTLPENTSLQRAVKKHLTAGGKIGIASGVWEQKYK